MFYSFFKKILQYKLIIGVLLLLFFAILQYLGYQQIKSSIPNDQGSTFLLGIWGYVLTSLVILFYIGILYLKYIIKLDKNTKQIAQKQIILNQ